MEKEEVVRSAGNGAEAVGGVAEDSGVWDHGS